MLLKPTHEDFKVIGFHIGRLLVALSLTMLIPLITAAVFNEINFVLNFSIGLLVCICTGLILQLTCQSRKDISWAHGMAVVALSWLAAMVMAAIPLYLSGHYLSFLDACFDSLSGFATTGLILIQNLDHASYSLNMWRHLIMFLGGQGIIVIGLTFFIRGTAGTLRLYVGEAREEKILPNVIQTARFIWGISLAYLISGTIILGLIAFREGLPLVRSFLHASWLFMAAFDTGGFTPQSQSILYYHSLPIELITMLFMVMGTLNFGVHYAIWARNFKEPFKNIEIHSLICTSLFVAFLVFAGLIGMGAYPELSGLVRKGLFQVVSAHTGTGYQTVYASQFVNQWGVLAMFGLTLAMAFGGSVSSTAGGIKALRIGLFFKSLFKDIKKLMLPPSAVVVSKFHHFRDSFLDDRQVRSVLLIMLAYIVLYVLGGIVGLFYGYPLEQAIFESTSAAANVGLSCGITKASMPTFLKIFYMFQMWLGRLEFMSAFAFFGLLIAWWRGKK